MTALYSGVVFLTLEDKKRKNSTHKRHVNTNLPINSIPKIAPFLLMNYFINKFLLYDFLYVFKDISFDFLNEGRQYRCTGFYFNTNIKLF